MAKKVTILGATGSIGRTVTETVGTLSFCQPSITVLNYSAIMDQVLNQRR